METHIKILTVIGILIVTFIGFTVTVAATAYTMGMIYFSHLFHHSYAGIRTGQFWGIPININPYRGVWRGSFTPLSARWNITMMPTAPASPRSFAAILGSRTWTHDGRPVIPNSVCLYAGDSQGGPLGEARNFDFGPVVEGHYTEYICEGGIYDTTFTYSKYTGP